MFALWWAWVLDHIFPPYCPSCYASVQAHGHVCAVCFQQLHAIHDPKCDSCGTPFSVAPLTSDALCVTCLSKPPLFDQARSVWVYNSISARLIKQLKLHDNGEMVAHFAGLMRQSLRDVKQAPEVIVPVPMHWKNLLLRRYNPAVWLAGALSQHMGIEMQPKLLYRKKRTRNQRGLTRAARLRNIAGAFAVQPAFALRVKGQHVLLVDDVITTGATANACARALLRAGAKTVVVATLARTLLEDI